MTRVLMFSGGLDSFVLARTWHIDYLIYVDMKTGYSDAEWDRIKDIDWGCELIKIDFPMTEYELDNKIIPYRNHMLAMLGAQYGNKIMFGFTAGDTTKDKDFVFKSQIEGILNYFALDKHKVKVQEYPYEIEMPIRHLTKTEIVTTYLCWAEAQGGDIFEYIHQLYTISRSCYESKKKECGVCRACLRKYVALKLNKIPTTGIFHRNPEPYLSKFLQESIEKGRRKEVHEIAKVLEQNGGP